MRSFSTPRRATAPTHVTVQIQNLSFRSIDCSTEHLVQNGRGDTRKATKRSDRENGVETGRGAEREGGEGIANSSGNKIKNCCLYSLKHKAERRIMSSDTVQQPLCATCCSTLCQLELQPLNPNSTNCLVFIMQKHCVYCEAGIGFLIITCV
jgi:hypothetical protein